MHSREQTATAGGSEELVVWSGGSEKRQLITADILNDGLLSFCMQTATFSNDK